MAWRSSGSSPISSRNSVAAVGRFETPELARVGAREGAFLVTEQLALDQPRGQRGAVELDEGLGLAPAAVVDSACDQLLAGTGLAGHEHGGVGGGDLLHRFERRVERPRAADDLREVVLRLDLVLEGEGQPVQPVERRLLTAALLDVAEDVRIERLTVRLDP